MKNPPLARPNGPPTGAVDPVLAAADETVRRQVATQLLSGLLASGDYLAEWRPPPKELAIDAVDLADALLDQLETRKR